MIGYFPKAYPDELFYSICARFSDKMQYPRRGGPLQEIFGTATVKAIIDLPSHLELFINRLPSGHRYTIDKLIDDHTLFPFYRPFLKLDWQQRVRNCMQKDDGARIHTLIAGSHTNLYTLRCFRFCRLCVEADRQMFGECYWHRVHQLSCVRIWALRNTLGVNSTIQLRISVGKMGEGVHAKTTDIRDNLGKRLFSEANVL